MTIDKQLLGLLADAVGVMVNTWTVLVAAGIFVAFRAVNNWPMLASRNAYRRMLPVLPELTGVMIYVLGCLPIILPEGVVIGHRASMVVRVGLGLWSAYMAQKFRKVLSQTVLGDDARITFKPAVDLTVVEDNEDG